MKKAYITGATGAIGMALVGELLKNRISTTVFLRKDSGRNDRVKDSFSGELARGLLRIEYVSLEELSGYALSRNTQDMKTYASQDLLTKAAGGSASQEKQSGRFPSDRQKAVQCEKFYAYISENAERP